MAGKKTKSSPNILDLGLTNKGIHEQVEYVPDDDIILEVRTLSGVIFKNLLDTLKAVLTEANIIFTKKGLKLVVIDAKKHAVVHLFMDSESESFQLYHCTEEKVVLGIDIELFYKTIKTNKTNDLLCLILRKSNKRHLEISFENIQKGTKTVDKLPLRSLQETIITEQIKYPVPTEMDSLCFQNTCREMASFGATLLQIESRDNKLIFSNKDGEPKRVVSVSIKDSKGGKNTVPQKGIFLLSFLKPFAKATNLSTKVKIYLKSHNPLTMEYTIENLGTLKYLLAPEDDDDDDEDDDEESN
jgi:proliferating cell nuclear antigen